MNERIKELKAAFENTFSCPPERFFSAPGRTEICGNHTDHQHGMVFAASVNKDTVAAVRQNDLGTIRILSKGYTVFEVPIQDLEKKDEEQGSSKALIRGIARAFSDRGEKLKGFDAYITSQVGAGSGISSSAAFEVLVAEIINAVFCEHRYGPLDIAKICNFAENVYFGKPSGLMDQTASAVGGLVFIDFKDPSEPIVEKIGFDFTSCGYTLLIIDAGSDHADLTREYAAVTNELKSVCEYFGKKVLREVPESDFLNEITALREKCGDRAVLRAMHVYEENKRVKAIVSTLKHNDIEGFLDIVNESGRSSECMLQNITPCANTTNQEAAFLLNYSRKILGKKGAVRIHGGGFGGTVQAFVPNEMLDEFICKTERVMGINSCAVMSIRPYGAAELDAKGNVL